MWKVNVFSRLLYKQIVLLFFLREKILKTILHSWDLLNDLIKQSFLYQLPLNKNFRFGDSTKIVHFLGDDKPWRSSSAKNTSELLPIQINVIYIGFIEILLNEFINISLDY